jgi:signal transduction histidine kinase
MGLAKGIPMRWKILVALLFVVTTVVGLITFTMAGMFHTDKKAYVSDMVSVIAVHAAEEAKAVLAGYRDRLLAFAEVVDDPALASGRKPTLMRDLFSGMEGFVGIRIFEDGVEVGSLYDRQAIEAAGLNQAVFASKIQAQLPRPGHLAPGAVQVMNSTVSHRLPTLTMTVASLRRGSTLVLSGVLDLDRVLALGRSSKAFEVFLVDAQGNVLVHGDPRYVVNRTRLGWIPAIPEGSLAVVREYSRDQVDMIGGFARVGFGDLRIGAQIPRAAAYFASRRLLIHLVLVALALLLGSTVAGLVWSSRITRSIGRLADATRAIAQGDFGVQVSVDSRDEMGQLAGSFNRMTSELARRESELERAQAQLIHSEKMAAFGQLGAGIAHEVKNPLAGIQGIVQLSARGLDPAHPLAEPLAIIEKEVRRCGTIIDNLLRFARQHRLALEPMALEPMVEDAAAIMRHQMSLHGVTLSTQVEPGLPQIRGSANQLQQVLMNLMLNAQQAMEGRGGVVEVEVRRAGEDAVEIRVHDNGPGIPKEIRERIFEPFFTTKPTGQGTGLGLSVSFGIIREHHGTIAAESEPGRGTTFVIRLPLPGAARPEGGDVGAAGAAAAAEAA